MLSAAQALKVGALGIVTLRATPDGDHPIVRFAVELLEQEQMVDMSMVEVLAGGEWIGGLVYQPSQKGKFTLAVRVTDIRACTTIGTFAHRIVVK